MTSAPPINTAKLRAFAALMRRWFAFVLLWLARLPMKRSRDEIERMEGRLKYLIGASVLLEGFQPGKARMGAHLTGRAYKGAWMNFVLRNALPPLSAFGYDRIARIKHVAARIDFYVQRFMRRLKRGFLMRRTALRGTAPRALMSHAPALLVAVADTS
ncbi:hypothetical protein U91I_00809 [alpha proteobacterium U9-1i]|nr:hypothetical protein U91I_00809 [alpha proteobacterium U9-1i]